MNYNPKYQINLTAVFNRAYADRSSSFRDKLRPYLKDPEFRQIYGTRVVDTIIENTLEGKDKKGKMFVTYSDAYKKSLKYRAYAKQGNVNLRLTGSMLADLRDTDSFNTITIALKSQRNKNKADGHITGGRGKWNKNGPLKKRDFLGLKKEKEEELLVSSLKDIRAESLVVQADLFEAFAAIGMLQNVGVGFDKI